MTGEKPLHVRFPTIYDNADEVQILDEKQGLEDAADW